MTTTALGLWLVSWPFKIVVGAAPENTVASLHLLGAFNPPLQSIAIVLLSLVIVREQRALAVFGLVSSVSAVPSWHTCPRLRKPPVPR